MWPPDPNPDKPRQWWGFRINIPALWRWWKKRRGKKSRG